MADKIDAEDGARIAEAATEARLALENWVPNEDPAPGFRADHAIEVCAEFERSMSEWSDAAIDRLIKLTGDLDNAIRGARDADARFGAQQILVPINALYVAVSLASRKIEDARLQAQRAAELSLLTEPLPRTDIEGVSDDISEQAERVAEPANRVKASAIDFEAKAKFDASLFALEILGVKVHVGRLQASLADVKISFKSNQIYRGVVEIAQFQLAKALAALELTRDQILAAPGQMVDGAEAALEALQPLLQALQETDTEGTKLRLRIEAAIRENWVGEVPDTDGEDLTPWPTGIRPLPPVWHGDAPQRVELEELQRFEAGDNGIFGIAPLSAERFLSSIDDTDLALWRLGSPRPQRRMKAHKNSITRVAALDARHAVSASTDKSLILWDVESGESLRRLEGHEDWAQDVAALLPTRFVSAGVDGRVLLWDRDREAPLAQWEDHDDPTAVCALTPDRFLSGDFDKPHLAERQADSFDTGWQTRHATAKTWKLAAIDRERALSVLYGHRLALWRIGSEAPLAVLDDASGDCQDAALLSTGCAASAHEDGLALWTLPQDGRSPHLLTQAKTAEKLFSVRALPSPDPMLGRLIVGGRNGYLAYWEARFR